MRKDVVILGGTAAVLVAAVVVGGTYYSRSQEQAKEQAAAAAPAIDPNVLERPHSPSLGPKDAKVTIVEFLDPECESCRAMSPMVKHVLAQYPGKVRLVVRHLPFHKNSLFAISALYAAREQGKYWELLDSLFANQPAWGDHHHPKPELVPEFARQVGLDMDAFSNGLSNPAAKQYTEQDQADAKVLGVNGTPTFFVNGKMLEQLGYDQLKAMVDEQLAK
ncbi:MAG TPA: thioredoxin domain-containing protein [Polyangia bacterium]